MRPLSTLIQLVILCLFLSAVHAGIVKKDGQTVTQLLGLVGCLALVAPVVHAVGQ